ncbi:MAG: AMP-binding protein [Acidimicrobiales bacterium]|nr:AMP-binding protein [Acidimicrobiales bacterium]
MRIIDFFDEGVRMHPDNVAFIDDEGSATYAEASTQTHRVAGAIRGHGYLAGTKIGVYSPNSTAAFIALLGLMRAQGIWLPINPRNSVDDNVDLASRFDMSVLFYHSSFEQEVAQISDRVPGITDFVCIDDLGTVGQSLDSWCAGHPDHHEVSPEETDELMAIFPTGGTTGLPKGVLMNHRAIETLYASFYSHFGYYEDSTHLVVAPMTHTAGILGCMHFVRGGTNVIMAQADPLSILQAIDRHEVTHLFLPPTVLYMMLALPELYDYDYSSLRHFIVGAAPTSIEKLKEAIGVFGPVMTEAYGQAECPAAITLKAPWDYLDEAGNINEERLRGIGRPAIFNRVAMLDPDGVETPRGTPGEICVRGSIVTLGYYENPEATAEARRHGWHWTGDIGVMDDDGYVRIVDRSKDMIITGGFNVYPNEVEQVLMESDAVQDAAVIGVPDEKWGEAVKAVVQLRPGRTIEADELLAMVRDRLGGVKTPKTLDVVADLPRSAAGKVLKTDLRAPYWSGLERGIN